VAGKPNEKACWPGILVVPYVVVVVEYVHCDCETVRRGRVVPEFVESRSLAPRHELPACHTC
jgi:hypothetical protein